MTRKDVKSTVTQMNWHFGKGDVVRLEWNRPDGGYVVVKPFKCREEKYMFRTEKKNGKLYVTYRSHRRLVRKAS